MIKRNYLIVTGIVLITMAAILWYINSLKLENQDIESGKAIISNFACYDGCFYALCKPVYYENETGCDEQIVNNCVNKCFNKFIISEINKTK